MTVRNGKTGSRYDIILRSPPQVRRDMTQAFLQTNPDEAPEIALALVEQTCKTEQDVEKIQVHLRKLELLIEELTAPQNNLGAVVSVEEEHCLVAVGPTRAQLRKPKLPEGETLKVGDVVTLSREGNAILKRLPAYRPVGRVGAFRSWFGGQLRVEIGPEQTVVLDVGPGLQGASLREGDQVLYHPEWHIAWSVVEQASAPTEETFEPIGWEQIGGLDEQMSELKMAVELGVARPELTAEFGLPAVGGITLVGHPGTGKTMLVKALATWVQEQFNRRVLFRNVPPGSWRSSWYGQSEERIVAPLRQARAWLEEGQADLVIVFYDEMDTLGTRSSDVTNHIDSRVMTAFLSELDGLAGRKGILVCGATNRVDQVDEGLLRKGRFGDLILHIPRPGREAARSILKRHLPANLPYWTDGDADDPGQRCIDAVVGHFYKDADGGDALVELVLADGQRRPVFPRDVMSGAVLANVALGAKREALRRSLSGPKGMTPDDLLRAAGRELDVFARRLQDPGKAREILGERELPIVRVEPIRLARTARRK